jgi:hypothetical protein
VFGSDEDITLKIRKSSNTGVKLTLQVLMHETPANFLSQTFVLEN